MRGPLAAFAGILAMATGAQAQSSSIVPEGAPVQVASSTGSDAIGGRPAIAWDGTRFLVGWRTSTGAIRVGRVNTTGSMADPSGIDLGTGTARPSIAFDGTNYMVVWESGGEVKGARVSPAGAVLDSPALTLTTGGSVKDRPVTIAYGGGQYLIAWRTTGDNLRSARISTAGLNLDAPAGTQFGNGFYPWLSYDGTNFLVVWHYHGAAGLDIYGSRISPANVSLDGTGFVVFTAAEDQDHASVAFDGTNYLVAWHDFRGGDVGMNDGTAYAVRVSPAGSVVDASAIKVADYVRGQVPVATTFDGTHFVVAWQYDLDPYKFRLTDVYARRIASNGTLVDATPSPIATSYGHQFGPSLTAGGSFFFAAWSEDTPRCAQCVYGQVLKRAAAFPTVSGGGAASSGSWQSATSPTGAVITAVWGADNSTVFAAGEAGTLKYSSGSWSLAPQSRRSFGVWASSATEALATGWCGVTYRYDGNSWTDQGCHGNTTFGLWGATPASGSAVVDAYAASLYGEVLRLSGSTWFPEATGLAWTTYDAWGTSASNVYVSGEFGSVARRTGAWSQVTGLSTGQTLNGIWGTSASDIFVVGDHGAIARYDGSSWTLQASGTTEHLYGVGGLSGQHVYAVGANGTLLRYDGSSWRRETSGTTQHLYDVTVGGGAAWAVGNSGTILQKPLPSLALGVSSRLDSLPAGSSTRPDSAAVTLTGTGASTTAWTASHRTAATWVTLATGSGTGSGMLRWTRNATGLGVGTYVDTIVVSAPDAIGSGLRIIDTLIVRSATTLALSPSARVDSVAHGATAGRADSANVTLSGYAASSTAWTATHRAAASWLTLTNSSGTGSGTLRWSRNPSGLATGTYVDTITVTAGSLQSQLLDTLIVRAALTLALDRGSARDSVVQGSTGSRADSTAVSLTGLGSGGAAWSATHSQAAAWISLVIASGTGSGMLRWTRTAGSLAPGTYVDTISVTASGASGSPRAVVDTFIIVPPLAVALSASSRRDSVVEGTSGSRADSVILTLAGFGLGSAAWTATHRSTATWLTLASQSGTGGQLLRWTRQPAGLAPGTWVDTITVTVPGALGSPARVVDTLIVAPGLRVVLAATSRRDTTFAGVAHGQRDSVDLAMTGNGATAASWTLTHRAAATWLTLATSSGAGSGIAKWSRSAAGLAAGTYVDTITVAVAGALNSPAIIVDSLVVKPVPVTSALVLDAIMAGAPLTQEQVRYLDLLGNRNGFFDVGDFLAYTRTQPLVRR